MDPTEQRAIGKLLDHFNESQENAEYKYTAVHVAEGNATYDETLTDRLQNRAPPDLFLSSPGAQLEQWCPDEVEQLSDALTKSVWLKNSDQLGDQMSHSLPIGVHRVNLLIYAKRFFDADGGTGCGEDSWTTPDKLLETVWCLYCKSARDSKFFPFALGAADDWPVSLILWESLLLASVPHDTDAGAFSQAYFSGEKCAHDDSVRKALCDLSCLQIGRAHV